MDVWPPPPIIENPELKSKLIQAGKKDRVGAVALAFSAASVLIRAVVFLKIHSNSLGGLSLVLVSVGLVLGLISRSSLAGRLALLGPLLFLGLMIYYILSWYGI